jgi:hypothetical protein
MDFAYFRLFIAAAQQKLDVNSFAPCGNGL